MHNEAARRYGRRMEKNFWPASSTVPQRAHAYTFHSISSVRYGTDCVKYTHSQILFGGQLNGTPSELPEMYRHIVIKTNKGDSNNLFTHSITSTTT